MSERQQFVGGPHDGETIPAGLNRTTLNFLVEGASTDEFTHTYTLYGGGRWKYMGILYRNGERDMEGIERG